METLREYFAVFFCSMVPVLELRASIPLGAGFELPWVPTFLVSVVGNMLPVPFILLFIRRIIAWMHTTTRLRPVAEWLEKKAAGHSDRVKEYASLGLVLLVGIPLPGTGAWTGALVAALLGIRMKYALPAIFAGVLLAGFIVSGVCYGFLSFLSFLV